MKINDNVLTQDIDATDLFLHAFGIDLAHVTASVRLLDLANPELPDPVIK